MKAPVEKRVCPHCGDVSVWKMGLVRHVLEGVKYVHLKIQNEHAPGRVHIMASILRNGARLLPE